MIQDFVPDTHAFYLEADKNTNKAKRVVLLAKEEVKGLTEFSYTEITEERALELLENDKYVIGWNHAAMHYCQWGAMERHEKKNAGKM